jgi:hypothetical protein
MAIKIKKNTIDNDELRRAIQKAEMDEIMLLFIHLLASVFYESIKSVKPLKCHLFTVQKFLVTGDLGKGKSKMVVNGNEQDTDVYPDCLSPTIAIHSLLTYLSVVVCNKYYKLAKIDVKDAFIQTEVQGTDVYIKCHPNCTTLIVKCLPGIKINIANNAMLYCKQLEALSGYIQVSKLWFQKLTKFL